MLNRHLDAAAEPILVKTVFSPSAGVANPAFVLDVGKLGLSGDGGGRIDRVVIRVTSLDGGAVRNVRGIERDEDGRVFRLWEKLQYVHIIGQGDKGPRTGVGWCGQEVPCGPGNTAAREERDVRVEVSCILCGLKVGKDAALFISSSVFDDLESLVAVARQYHVVEEVFVFLELQDDLAVDVLDPSDRRPQVNTICREIAHDGINVLVRAAWNGHPAGPGGDGVEQVVVPHEPD